MNAAVRRAGSLAGGILAALSLACFEQPVTESLYLRFLPGNSVVIGITVQLASEEAFKENRAARDRIVALRQDLLQGKDEWSRRLEKMSPDMERLILDSEGGRLQSLSRRAILADSANVQAFFSDTMVRAQVTRQEDGTELALVPDPGGRATRAQRQELETRLGPWLASYARYLSATKALYDDLERNPAGAPACFAAVLRGEIQGSTDEEGGTLTAAEGDLTETLRKAMDEVSELFAVPDQNPYSLEELSRLVYDPFPAPLTVQSPGPLLAVEGFERQGSQVVRVPELSLWNALLAERERWVAPDLLEVEVLRLRDTQPVDPASLASRPRRAAAPPTPLELRQILEARLSPASLYRVRWSTRGLKELDPSEGLEPLWASPPSSRE